MKTTLITAALCLGLAASASADTTLDLLSTVADMDTTHAAKAFNSTGITDSTIASWLNGQSDGLYWTHMNGSTTSAASGADSVSPSLTSGESGYTLSFTNRAGYSGSVVGIATTISEDTSSLTSLDLSYTASTSVGGTIYLVYQVDGEWTMKSAEFTQNETATITIDLSETALSSSTVYAVVVTTTGGGSKETGTISLTATSGAVPEPATATLGLLALGALALRRRRA